MKRRNSVKGLALIYGVMVATVVFYGLAIDPLLDAALTYLTEVIK